MAPKAPRMSPLNPVFKKIIPLDQASGSCGPAALTALPPLALEAPCPSPGERGLRWGSVIFLHLLLLYGVQQISTQSDPLSLLHPIAVRLLPLAEEKKPEPLPPPKPAAASPRNAPPRLLPQPVLSTQAPEAPSRFTVAPQPPAPPPAPLAAAVAPAPIAAPALVSARFDADYLHNPKPVYPAFSRRNGEEGKVLLRVKVSAEGAALELDIKQSSGFPRLDNAAREAVAKWRFVPARRGEEAIESWVTVPLTFALE